MLVVPSITTDTDESKTDNDAQAVLDLTPVSVGDYVWWDVNRNGVQDKGESPIQDVVVTLYQADGTTKVTDTKTDDKGFYSFTDLAPGQNYVIVFTKPDGTTFTTALQGDVATDSNPNNSGVAPFVTPKSGSNSATNPDLPTIDAGLVQLNLTLKKVRVTQGPFGSSDLVTYTLTPHNDGPVNALTGWTVTDHLPVGLTLVSMTGDATAYSCDSASGICTSKVGLDAGKDAAPITVTARINAYTTGILQNVAWVSPGPGETPETNQLVVPTLPAPGQPPVETGATETDNDADASLELLPVSVGDYVWWDVNRNGTQDNGEAPVAGVVGAGRLDGRGRRHHPRGVHRDQRQWVLLLHGPGSRPAVRDGVHQARRLDVHHANGGLGYRRGLEPGCRDWRRTIRHPEDGNELGDQARQPDDRRWFGQAEPDRCSAGRPDDDLDPR